MRIDAKFNGTDWTAITDDTVAVEGLTIVYGIRGSGPMDNLASTGICQFTLANWPTTRGDALGRYSPSHGNVKSGWGLGLPIRVVFLSGADFPEEFVKFYGKVQYIDPEPGLYKRKRVHVIAHDYIGDLAEAVIRSLPPQESKTDRQLLDAVLAELPASAVPPATDLDTAIDTYPYADFGDGQSALSMIKDVLNSTFGMYVQHGDGTHVYKNRETRTFTPSAGTFTDADLVDLKTPSDLRQVYNRVIVKIPQIQIGDTTQVLASFVGEDQVGIEPGAEAEIFLSYRDPNDDASRPVLIGGTDFVDPPTSGTDYVFNTSPDGSGTDVTSQVTVTATFFSGAVKYEFTNNYGATVYWTTLQARGKAIRRLTSITAESVSSQSYGERTLEVDARFQDNQTVAQFIAKYLRGQYETFTHRPVSLTLKAPNADPDRLRHVLEREPGDRITLSETVTGLAADAIIQSVSISVKPKCWIACEWGLAPQSDFMFLNPWRLGLTGLSELGQTTVLG